MLKLMKILAIETSCDDTCIAVAECHGSNFELLSNIVSSQIEVHKKFGVIKNLAGSILPLREENTKKT